MLLPSNKVFLLLVFYSTSHFHILIFATAQLSVARKQRVVFSTVRDFYLKNKCKPSYPEMVSFLQAVTKRHPEEGSL